MRLSSLMLPAIVAATLVITPSIDAQTADPVSASVREQYALIKRTLIAAAQAMPEQHYGFQATPEVRTYAQLVGHVANAQFTICSGLRGEANPAGADIEKTMTSKADLVGAITRAFEYCDQPYASVSDTQLAQPVNFFGGQKARHFAMTFALMHAYEHYGNMVTYMRLKGIVPPTSQGN